MYKEWCFFCRQETPRRSIVEWLHEFPHGVRHQLDETLCGKWQHVRFSCHQQLYLLYRLYVMQLQNQCHNWRFKRLCRSNHQLGRNAEDRIGGFAKEETWNVIVVMYLRRTQLLLGLFAVLLTTNSPNKFKNSTTLIFSLFSFLNFV